ncbi:uncharacterized protein A4U43_C05F27990 [Asparagus officinalis]|uniref:Uncharacterized protein n=1 Tax=Asparagus officinalis TaxID=4686 RepID=A0A5P1EXI8_ASPOF|nr:uncharacterized protein A4U43_C05F27990 [Asparagus officinalis]
MPQTSSSQTPWRSAGTRKQLVSVSVSLFGQWGGLRRGGGGVARRRASGRGEKFSAEKGGCGRHEDGGRGAVEEEKWLDGGEGRGSARVERRRRGEGEGRGRRGRPGEEEGSRERRR